MCCIQLQLFYVSDCVFMLFCIINIFVHAITHSEFSQDDVSGTKMNVHPF